mmetsp:Transcript_105332/g.250756  ORF Transcript_105332/g.250756 Transcript_105332/m.250756 type:complete len:225 (-) Transcript_105332:3461-4135(-)
MLCVHGQPGWRNQSEDQGCSERRASLPLQRGPSEWAAFVGPRGRKAGNHARGSARGGPEQVHRQVLRVSGGPEVGLPRGGQGVLVCSEPATAGHAAEEHQLALWRGGLHGSANPDGHELPGDPIEVGEPRAGGEPRHAGGLRRPVCAGAAQLDPAGCQRASVQQLLVPLPAGHSYRGGHHSADCDELVQILHPLLQSHAHLPVCGNGDVQLCTGIFCKERPGHV